MGDIFFFMKMVGSMPDDVNPGVDVGASPHNTTGFEHYGGHMGALSMTAVASHRGN
jgi:hypothetical protein